MFQALCLIVIALLAVIDQLIKIIMEVWLKPIGSSGVIKGFISFAYLQNRGAAFGVLQNGTVILSIITFIVIIAGIYLVAFNKIKSKFECISISLVISGGLGNLIDRVFRGYVVDFIKTDFMDFPVFNFADCLITVGACMLVGYLIYSLIKEYKEKKENSAVKTDGEAEKTDG
ncbi:MAG: signal peptidase II [Clostridiales bacterium]|nr:signal peptidase II [Clostridiales bacterium]